jgi:hypothetical protein
MVQYRFAIDSSDKIVDAKELRGQAIPNPLWCVSCGQQLVAKVDGKIKQPHFAHKVQVECNGETYLHRLAKLAFLETYNQCIHEGVPYIVAISVPKRCERFNGAISCFSKLPSSIHEFNLTSYYSEVAIEAREGEFIPDILLKSTSKPEEKVFVEIAVTHFLSNRKKGSGRRIIEIPVKDESSIDVIRSRRLGSSDAAFIGFHPSPTLATHDECLCAGEPVYGFFVYKSGKAYLEYSPVALILAETERLKSTIIYLNIFRDKPHQVYSQAEVQEIGNFDCNRGFLFVEQVILAESRRVPIKNCFLCRYSGDNWDGDSSHSIYCKTYRKACNSNEASVCDRYRLKSQTA